MEEQGAQNRRFFIGKIGISAVNMESVLDLIDRQVRLNNSAYICVANVRTSVFSQKNEEFCRINNKSFLTLPDGMPLIWFARLAGYKEADRVTGADLMIRLLELSGKKGYTHYFYGDTKGTLTKMIRAIRNKYPDACIAGSFSPPFRPLSDNEVKESICYVNRLKPTFLWVALGAPKQEYLMARMMDYIENSIIIGVGAGFRFMVGEYKHPPAIIQKCGLEGIYWRFMKDPLSKTKWYLYHIPAFGKLLLTMLIKRTKY